MSTNSRGLTLLETTIAAALLALLTGALFVLYQMGAAGWAKGEVRSEMLADLQNTVVKLEKDVSTSIYDSLSLTADGSALSFLSARDADGTQQFDVTTGKPIWRRYVIYWWDSNSQEVHRRELALDENSPEETAPGPIESYGPGNPLADYLSGGRVVARHIIRFQVSCSGPDAPLETELRASRDRYGKNDPELAGLNSTVFLRNGP